MVEYVSKLQDNIHYHAVYWQYMVGLGLNQKWWKIWKKFPATYSIYTPQTYFTPQSNFTPLLHRKQHRKIL